MRIIDLDPEKKNGKMIYRRKIEAIQESDIDSLKGRQIKFDLIRFMVNNVEMWRIPLTNGQFQKMLLSHNGERWSLTLERQEDAT